MILFWLIGAMFTWGFVMADEGRNVPLRRGLAITAYCITLWPFCLGVLCQRYVRGKL
jgi:hypothetical protein